MLKFLSNILQCCVALTKASWLVGAGIPRAERQQINPRLCCVVPKGLCAHSYRRSCLVALCYATWCSLWCFCHKTNSGGFSTCFPTEEACLWEWWTTAIALMLEEQAESLRKKSWAVGWRYAQAWERCSGTSSSLDCGQWGLQPLWGPKETLPCIWPRGCPSRVWGSTSFSWHPRPGFRMIYKLMVLQSSLCLRVPVNDTLLFREFLLSAIRLGYVLTELSMLHIFPSPLVY